MGSLVGGMNFLLDHVDKSSFMFSEPLGYDYVDLSDGTIYPYMVVNIGSGVSILQIDSPTHFKRISGTMIGGGTN